MKETLESRGGQPLEITKERRMRFALILGALAAFGPLSIDMYLPSLPILKGDLHTTASMAQLTLTAFLLGLASGQLFNGALSDVRGRRLPLIIGLVLYTITSFACALSPSIWLLIILRFIQGVTGSAGIVIARAAVRDLYSGTELTKFFSLLMLVNGAAPILAPVAGGFLLKVTSWRGVFIVLTIIGIIMLLAVIFGLPETLPKERRFQGGLKATFLNFGSLLKDRIFMGYVFSQALVMGAMFAYISGSPFVIQDVFGASPQVYSFIFAMNGVGIIIATQSTGRLAGRIKESKMLLTGLCIVTVTCILLLVGALSGVGLGLFIPSLFFVVACVGIVSTTCFSLAMQNHGQSAGSASALLGLMPFILGSITSPLVGIGGSETAVPMASVIATCDVGALLIYFFLVLRQKRGKVIQ
ncbi:DHA1 family bicyclomycin/chloramphenicol resistance-like MFS transporter [Pullulanibacillus pueri]|uniref:Bcr/CflA family efflux transporter n=1 Tax=Pullulanibacillus pueri TaxID=1437324 RepID=A0A8J2ZVR5_9BACL|nr:multidrug effflux MFS transporter [Pullulanibacillus pueri]MBM7682351.1 DHA1 family bicyclomycin/chloramphenicol resistance-like MFS transporter [Pullulanibacillus pueri]GGH80694.1 Bcr/CflA family drug resistance efflux transporter [Pullulanibacillus pueri]